MEGESSALSANCPCDVHSCPSMIQASRSVDQMHPRLAVATAAKEAPTSAFVNRVAVATLHYPYYRRAGAAKMFIRHILSGQRSTDYPHWYHSAIGIVNVFDGIYKDNTQIEDAAILQELHSSYWKILDVFWEERHFLQGEGPLPDERRVIVSEVIGMYLRNPRLKLSMYEHKTMTLVMNCWLKSSLKHGPRRLTVETAHDMLDMNTYGPPPDNHLELFFNVIDIDYFISRVISALNHKKHIGYCLARELSLITAFACDKKVFVPHFIARGLYKHVKNAMHRQMKAGGESTEDVLAQSSMILCFTLENSSNYMATLTEMLEQTRIVKAGALAFIMACKSQTPKAEIWFHFFSHINHVMTCERGNACPSCKGPVPESFLKAARTSLEPVAIPTWEALRQAETAKTSKYLALWYEMILLLGITRESIRERYRLEKKCCNLDCPTRNSGGRSEKKSTCVRCYSVYYCDRVCQRSDWNNSHKSECKKYTENNN